ncbi:unnamed protein product [Absidia cylindrospora]
MMWYEKKKSNQDPSSHDSANNDVYVQDDHLLNIKLPEDFSSIILPQLIGYEQDENGNTINSSTIILRQKQQQQQQIQNEEDSNHHSVPTREGWYPVTRLVGSESKRGTLVDTTNITAASLVQVNKRQSASLSSSYGDTLTCHSKEDSSGSLDLNESHTSPSCSITHSDKPDPPVYCIPHLQKDRPKFKRNYPRSTVLKFDTCKPNELPPADSSATQKSFKPRHSNSSTSGTPKKSIKPPTPFLSETCVEGQYKPTQNSLPANTPLIQVEEDGDDNDKKMKQRVQRRTSGIKLPKNELSSKQRQQQQKKRASAIIVPLINVEDNGSMIPRRPLSSSSCSSHIEKNTISTTTMATSKNKNKKQNRTMSINSTLGGGSRIPVRSQTMKV